MDWKNILERAAWTAVQAAVAAVPVAQLTAVILGGDVSSLQQLVLSGVSAAVGAALSFLKTVAQERLAQLGVQDGG